MKQIVWTESALLELNAVYDYFFKEVDVKIARQIKKKIVNRVKILEEHPFAGQKEFLLEELSLGHRYLVEGNYKIIYRIMGKQVFITDFFDTGQNPVKLIHKRKG